MVELMELSKYRDDGNGIYWDGTPEEEQAYLDALVPAKTEMLWQAAHNYEYAQVSGSAIGLITLGVLQSKPKCIAVQNWIYSIWNLYYTRKVLITATSTLDTDFSSCGQCPHTVPELIEELGFS